MLQTSEICRIASGHSAQSGQIDCQNLVEVLDDDNDGKTTSEAFLHLENLKMTKGAESTLTSGNLMKFAQRFQELNDEVRRLKDELASKEAEISLLKRDRPAA